MVTKTKKQGDGKRKKGKVKVLNLKKETVKDLTDEEAKGVKGGTTQCVVALSTVRIGWSGYSSVLSGNVEYSG